MNKIIENKYRYVIIASLVVLVLFSFSRYIEYYLISPDKMIIASAADDAYFYFEIAENLQEYGFTTFDGIHPTTGYHPLYLLLTVPIFELTSGKVVPLRIMGVITTILFLITSLIGIYELKDDVLSAAVFTGVCIFASPKIFDMMMESALVTPLALGLLFVVRRYEPWHTNQISIRNLVFIGMLITFTQFSRLDAVLLTVPLVITILVVSWRDNGNVNKLLWMVLPPLFGGISYLAYNIILTNRVTPTSSIAKSLSSPGFNTHLFSQIWSYVSLQSIRGFVYLGIIGFSALYLALYVTRRRTFDQSSKELVAAITSSFAIIQIFYYLFMSSAGMPPWYWYSPILVTGIVFPVFVTKAQKILRDKPGLINNVKIISVLLIIVTSTIFIPIFIPGIQSDSEAEQSSRYQSYLMAQYSNEELPQSARLAMGDGAGSFGYFSRHSVIHLEGLVNSPSVFEYIREERLDEYMSNKNVDYYVYERELSYNGDGTAITHPTDSVTQRTSLMVYKECEVFSSEFAKDRYIWDWECVQSRNNMST